VKQPIKLAPLAGGILLEYVERGEPSAVPVVFLHGFTDSWRSFAEVLPRLPQSYRAIALSQRGHGHSSQPPQGYGAKDFADDLAAFMDSVAVDRAIIVGHCLGSQVALRFAIDHPDRTHGLVLIAAYATLSNSPVAHELAEPVNRLRDPVDVDFVREFQESTLARPVPESFMEMVVAESCKVSARVWQATCQRFLQEDLTSALGSIMAPALLLWGDQDALVPRSDQDLLASEIPGARLRVYRGGGHGLHWEEPARVAVDVAEFVASISPPQRVSGRRLVERV
jgi:non-heme chloroperoxidase